MVKNNLSDSEMVVGVFQATSGSILCYYLFAAVQNVLNVKQFSFSFGWYFHTFSATATLSIMTIISGFLLLYSKRKGWVIAIISSFSILITQGFYHVHYLIKSIQDDNVKTPGTLLFFCICMLTFNLTCLLSWHFRNKYKPSRNNWIVIILISTLLSIGNSGIL